MRTKIILSILTALIFSSTSIAQKGEKKKEWDPEKRIEAKVERFSEKNELSEEQKIALKETLMEHHQEMKALKEAEEKRKKELWKEHKAERDQKVNSALNDEELSEAWKEFEKEEHQKMKQKRKKYMKHRKANDQNNKKQLQKD